MKPHVVFFLSALGIGGISTLALSHGEVGNAIASILVLPEQPQNIAYKFNEGRIDWEQPDKDGRVISFRFNYVTGVVTSPDGTIRHTIEDARQANTGNVQAVLKEVCQYDVVRGQNGFSPSYCPG